MCLDFSVYGNLCGRRGKKTHATCYFGVMNYKIILGAGRRFVPLLLGTGGGGSLGP